MRSDIAQRSSDNSTVLNFAMRPRIIESLVNAGACITRTSVGHTPLHAVARFSAGGVKQWLDLGLDPSTGLPSASLCEKLHETCRSECFLLASQLLIELQELQHTHVDDVEQAHYTHEEPEEFQPEHDENGEEIHQHSHKDGEQQLQAQNTPLHFAAATGNWLSVKYLLDAGAVQQRNTAFMTPLEVALRNAEEKNAKHFLSLYGNSTRFLSMLCDSLTRFRWMQLHENSNAAGNTRSARAFVLSRLAIRAVKRSRHRMLASSQGMPFEWERRRSCELVEIFPIFLQFLFSASRFAPCTLHHSFIASAQCHVCLSRMPPRPSRQMPKISLLRQ